MNFASYIARPLGLNFETQAPGEDVVLLLRKHPVTQIGWITISLVLILMPPFLLPLLLELQILPGFVTFNLILYLLLIWYLGMFGYAFTQFLLWYFNLDLVTSSRLVDIEFPFLLYREQTATRIEQLEDLTFTRGGLLRTTFNFGNVFVQTAGAKPNIEFIDVPDPARVVREIVNIWEEKEPERARAFLAKRDLDE